MNSLRQIWKLLKMVICLGKRADTFWARIALDPHSKYIASKEKEGEIFDKFFAAFVFKP